MWGWGVGTVIVDGNSGSQRVLFPFQRNSEFQQGTFLLSRESGYVYATTYVGVTYVNPCYGKYCSCAAVAFSVQTYPYKFASLEAYLAFVHHRAEATTGKVQSSIN